MIVIAVANLKGGSTKTTSAVFIAHALAEEGRRVMLVDADPQGSALRWHEYAGGFPFPVVALPVGRVHRDLAGFTAGVDAVVIDTPPLETQREIVESALRAASMVVVPCAPTPIEFERLAVVRKTLEIAGELRRDETEPPSAVLLTRTVAGAASTAAWRESIEEAGWRVLRPVVGRLERFSQAYATPVTSASQTAYGDALVELGLIQRRGGEVGQ